VYMRSKLSHWFKLIFTYPKKHFSAEGGSYDGYWSARGRTATSLSAWQKQRADIALSYIPKEDGVSIVDIGAGDGGVLSYMREKREGLTATGIDASDHALACLKELGFAAVKKDFSNVEDLSVPDTDYVLLFEIIEHVKESELLVKKALESAHKGVFISIPNTGFFPFRLRLLFGRFPVQWIDSPNEHLRFWTLADIRWWLKALSLDDRAHVRTYEGVPLLKNILPSWFAAGVVIFIEHE